MSNTCQYRTGRTLGSGTFAIVKEAIHVETKEHYACKVINKKLIRGREDMVRNEIATLQRISGGNGHVITLHDYFETNNSLYLVFDLCLGGELFERIYAKGKYYEKDALSLVRTILTAVSYIHSQGIVHRDLKPENLLFRTTDNDAEIMIADFGLSRFIQGGVGDEALNHLMGVCGTAGYIAPEVYQKTGHGKAVDIWAMGVITYYLLVGYSPFDRATPEDEIEAIITGNYKFEPVELWKNVSQTAQEFIKSCLTVDLNKRPTADEALQHQWFVLTPDKTAGDSTDIDLLPHLKRVSEEHVSWRKAVTSPETRVSMLAGSGFVFSENLEEAKNFLRAIEKYKEESSEESIEDEPVKRRSLSKFEGDPAEDMKEGERAGLKKQDSISVDDEGEASDSLSLETRMAKTKLDEDERDEREGRERREEEGGSRK